MQVRGVEYCCLCVDNGMGDYNSRMCATSAEPAPRLNSNPANVSSLDLKGVKPAGKGAGNPIVSVNVDMDLAPNLPVHIVLNQTGDSWVSGSHLQIIVSLTAVREPAVQEPAVQDNPGISPVSEGPSETAAITATNDTNATRASNSSDDSDCDSTGGHSTADNNTLCNSSRRELTLFSASHLSKKALQLGKEPLGSLSCGGAEPEMLQAQGVVIRRDTYGDEDLVQFLTSNDRHLSRRQMGNVNHPVKWYVQIGGLPDATVSPPVYDYASEGASSVSLLNYNPNQRYFVSLVPEVGYWKARVTFGRREMIYLQENKDTAFQVQADSRVFTTFQANTDGLVVLKMKISQSKNARVRVWVNINSPATERSWVKWVGGNDTEVNNVRNRFFASIHLIRSLGFSTATWTFQCDQSLDWTVHPSLLAPISIRIDTPNTFTIDPMNGAVLFRLSNGGKDSGRLYFQIMPASDPDSMRAYPSWQDLERAIKMVSVEWAWASS